jgi:hypothetical protein
MVKGGTRINSKFLFLFACLKKVIFDKKTKGIGKGSLFKKNFPFTFVNKIVSISLEKKPIRQYNLQKG